MTAVPTDLGTFRTKVVIPLTGLSGDDVGIAPDASHLAGGGYHVGCEDIQRIGKWNTDYSTRQTRDRLDGTNDASAEDIGDNWPHGGRAAWIRFGNLLVARMRAGDPDLAALRAVNFSPDGVVRRRYDSANPGQGVITSTDTVDSHTHLEWWRDTKGTAARARSLARIGQIIDAAITNTHLEDDMSGEYADQALRQLDGGNAVGDMYLRLLTGKDGHGKPSGDGASAANLTTLSAKLDAMAAVDERRDNATLAAVRALTVATGNDPQPILDAIARVGADTHAAIVDLQQQLAASQARAAKLAAALAAAGGALDGADDPV